MKKMHMFLCCLSLLLFECGVLHGQTTANENAFSAAGSAEEVQHLVEKFGKSFVTISYYFKLDTDTGLPPEYRIRYLCPNCHNYHSGSISELMRKNMPVTAMGFYIGNKNVISQDLGFRVSWIDRIEIMTADGKRIKAAVDSFCNDEKAVKLTLEDAPDSLDSLHFSEKDTLPVKAFFITKDNGLKIGGISPFSSKNVLYSLEAKKAFYNCPANTLLLDANNEPVSIMLTEQRSLDTAMSSPTNWIWTDIPTNEKALSALEDDIASSFYPVTVTLNSIRDKSQSSMHYIAFRSDNSVNDNNEFNCIAYLQEDGNLMTFLSLDPSQTARFDRATVVTKEGKTIKAAFVGSLRKFGILVLKPENPLTPGKVLLGNENTLSSVMLDNVIACTLTVNGKTISARSIKTRLLSSDSDYETTAPTLAQVPSDTNTFVFSKDLKMCIAPVKRRTIDEKDYSARHPEPRGIEEITAILNSDTPFDENNVPRAKDEQTKQIVNFGADFQELTSQMVKARKVERFFDLNSYELEGSLVTHVHPETIAARIGIQPNDIILYARPVDEFARVYAKNDDLHPFGDEFPWEEYDQLPEELFDEVPQPWGSVNNAFNLSLEKIGIGNDAIVAYIRDGKFQEAHFTITAADNCFESAPRHKSKAIGLTIAPLTPEVREYFKLTNDAPGLVIAAVRSGSSAAKAGLKPYEIITAINGTDIHSIDEFKELTDTQDEFSLSIRRLVKSRVVKVTPAE